MANVERVRKKGTLSPAELAKALLLQNNGQVPQRPERQGFSRLGEFSAGKSFLTLSSHSAPQPDAQHTDKPAGIYPSKPDNRPPGVQVGEGPKRGSITMEKGGDTSIGVDGEAAFSIIMGDSVGDITVGQEGGKEAARIESTKE